MLLTLGLETLLVILALFAWTLGWYFHLTLAVACVPAIPAVESFG